MNERYSRQILFREIGREGQEKLINSRVLIVGCGALGASHAEMLSRAGVGNLRIVDRDFVEFTNLQRQTLFKEEDAENRTPKAAAAKKRIAEINSEVHVEEIIADVNNSNIEGLLNGVDLVLDGTDNFFIRYLVNDACVKNGKTWIYGAAVSSYGTTMTVIPGETPCLRCVFEASPGPGEVVHVRQVDRRSNDPVEARASGPQNRFDVLERAVGLLGGIRTGERAGGRIERNLARRPEPPVEKHTLRVRTDGGRSLRGLDDGLAHGFLPCGRAMGSLPAAGPATESGICA